MKLAAALVAGGGEQEVDERVPLLLPDDNDDDRNRRRVISVLHQDFEENVVELVKSRKCLRAIMTISEMIGNTFLYIGSGISTVAAAANVITNSQEIVSTLLFSSTVCCAIHITLIGIAKCSSKEERQCDKHLVSLGEQVGFKVVPLPAVVEIASGGGGGCEGFAAARGGGGGVRK